MSIKYIAVLLILVGTVSCLPQGRIVNGTDSNIFRHPYMVSLRWNGMHMCGATILSSRWALTAAHCLYDLDISDLSLQYGITDIDPVGPNVIYLKRVILHWKYEHANIYPHDIALIELNEPLTYNYGKIAPVQLPNENFEIEQFIEGRPGEIAGWGLNATGGVEMTTLQEANVKIYSDDECAGRISYPILKDQICAGVDENGKGVCNSDSGGPLIYKGSIQLGVVSWGADPCGSRTQVFTKVSHYIDWIRRHIY